MTSTSSTLVCRGSQISIMSLSKSIIGYLQLKIGTMGHPLSLYPMSLYPMSLYPMSLYPMSLYPLSLYVNLLLSAETYQWVTPAAAVTRGIPPSPGTATAAARGATSSLCLGERTPPTATSTTASSSRSVRAFALCQQPRLGAGD